MKPYKGPPTSTLPPETPLNPMCRAWGVQQAPAPFPPQGLLGGRHPLLLLQVCADIYSHLALGGRASEAPLEGCTAAVRILHTPSFLLPLVLEASVCCSPEILPGGFSCDVSSVCYLVDNSVSSQPQLFSKAARQGVPKIEPLS